MKFTQGLAVAAAAVLVSSPAFATFAAVEIPEPSALSLIAATAVAVAIGARFIRRK